MIPKRKGYNIGANLVESLHFSSIGGGVIQCPVVTLVLPSQAGRQGGGQPLEYLCIYITSRGVLAPPAGAKLFGKVPPAGTQ